MNRKPLLLAALRTGAIVLAALSASDLAAAAGIPDPGHCTVESVIIGCWSGPGIPTPDVPCHPLHPGLTRVFVRDVNNLPIANSLVRFTFDAQGTPFFSQNVGVTVLCQQPILEMFTDASGVAQLSMHFGVAGPGATVQVDADGVGLGTFPAISVDYDGDRMVGLSDFALFASDYLAPALPHPRSDFDNCPSTTLPDFSFFVAQYLACNGRHAVLCP